MTPFLAVAVAFALALGGAVRPVPGDVTRPFAAPPHPYAAGHRGVDLAAQGGDPVVAALDGVVAFAGQVAGARWVTVEHGERLATTYGVFADLAVVNGQRVDAGQTLGHLAEGVDHLDWGARLDGGYVDPLLLLRRWQTHLAPRGDPV